MVCVPLVPIIILNLISKLVKNVKITQVYHQTLVNVRNLHVLIKLYQYLENVKPVHYIQKQTLLKISALFQNVVSMGLNYLMGIVKIAWLHWYLLQVKRNAQKNLLSKRKKKKKRKKNVGPMRYLPQMVHVNNVVHMKHLMVVYVLYLCVMVRIKCHLRMVNVCKPKSPMQLLLSTKILFQMDLIIVFLLNLKRYKQRMHKIAHSYQVLTNHHGFKISAQTIIIQVEEECSLPWQLVKFPVRIVVVDLALGAQDKVI